MWDVIVVGAGPAGAAVAKRCAEHGLSTLILEKERLPRDKVCGGMVMGPVAHALIKQEFGSVPQTVLSKPPSLSGYMFHVPGIGSKKLNNFSLLAWRRDLDYWMNQKAQAKGAEIWPGAKVISLRQKEQSFSVEIEKDKERQDLEARFIVGAEGMNSLVRKSLFPELKISYSQVYQEGYQGELALDKKYYHWFFPIEYSSSFFSVHQKDNFIIVSINGESGQVKQFTNWTNHFLAKSYCLDINQKPALRCGCVVANLRQELISHTFLPAKGNALLAGDAAGLILPANGEGIGTAIYSGLLAADSILEAVESGEQADMVYLAKLKPIISLFGELCPWLERINEETKNGGYLLPEVLLEAFHSALRMF
ncbi:NAD(P)/FAD-dependent oxidoreductase [Chloroflexota bacterium]